MIVKLCNYCTFERSLMFQSPDRVRDAHASM